MSSHDSTPEATNHPAGLAPLAGYAPGVPREVEVPTTSLSEVLHAAVRAYGDKPALDFFGSTTTYAELGAQVDAAARVLAAQGVKPGDRVSLIMPSCPQAVVAFYAVLEVGGIVVEQNPLSTAEELRRSFADHGAAVAVVWDKLADTIAGLALDHEVTLFTMDMTRALPLTKRLALRLPIAKARQAREAMTTRPTAGSSWEDALAQVDRARLPQVTPHHAESDDVALLQYTGGTTGEPKAAMLTHRNLAANVAQSRAWVPELREGQEVFYGILPLFHAYGMMLCLLCAVRLGGCLVLFPRFDLDMVLDAMKRRPATFLPAVPPIYARMAEAAPARGIDLGSIRWAISGAMPLPAELVEQWEALTGGVLIEGYGMTETSPIALGNPMAPTRRPGSVGLPYPSTEIRVVDPENPTLDRPAGEPGELLIRGPQVFAGYWNKPEETAAVMVEGGWLRTGDIVTVDEAGFVTIVDRIKDVIISGGFNVYPSEIEEVLREHPGVAQAAVVGVPGAAGSEDVVAVVVAEPGVSIDPAELIAFTRQHLAGYKAPRRVEVVDELPLSAIGKVLRKDVRADLQR
ncbi:long-chain-fatty-acid--CoA ligase [Nocardioides sp.]|uniref:long-chain-fatty-acid--CoA ligase n=1 Tax=Nocardioides sp. TaxID=35761 RepID=UPI00260B1AC1|nr:long-chain-fatty-acid--CoA ligase [Nocardioides sp.]